MLGDLDRARLGEVFGLAQQRGWIGRRAIDLHIDHALGFVSAVLAPPAAAVDLGSGGGLPALVLAAAWPRSRWTLVESSLSRAAFLEQQCAVLGWSDRIVVTHATAQSLGREELFRGRGDLVTARSFGPPSLVVEVAAPLLRLGGELITSAAPDAMPWPAAALASLGMGPDRLSSADPRFHRVTQLAPCPSGFPRSRIGPALF